MNAKSIASGAMRGAAAIALAVVFMCAACVSQAYAADKVAVTGLTGTTAHLTWTAPDLNPNDYVLDSYTVSCKNVNSSGDYQTVKDNIPATTTSGTVTGLKAGQEYSFQVEYTYHSKSYGTSYTTYLGSQYGVATVPSKISTVKLNYSYVYSKKGDIVWTKRSTADGYQIYLVSAKGKKKTITKTGSYNLYTAKLDPKQFYSVKVRSYVKLTSGKKVYSSWSPTRYINIQQMPKAKAVGTKKAKLSWSKVKGAKSYTVYASFKAKSGYKKIKTTKSTKYTISKIGKTSLKKYKPFYVYVKANKKAGGKTYQSQVTYYTRYTIY